MSPPLVVAFALAGRVDVDLASEPLGPGSPGQPGLPARRLALQRRSPSALLAAVDAATYRRLYADFAAANPLWKEIPTAGGTCYEWDVGSTYIQEPPFFEGFPSRRRRSTTCAAPAPSRSSATRSRPITSARPERSRRLARRPLPAGARRQARRLQQLRRAPRQRSRDDARHVRERAHQEPHGAGRRRGRTRSTSPPASASRSTTPRCGTRPSACRS